MLRRAKPRTKSARANAKVQQLPELGQARWPGYMPLYCAAQWIVTHGRTREINWLDEVLWREAYKALLDRIASEDVKVTSRSRPVAAMFITDVVRIRCPFGPVRGDFYYRKFICGFAVFFVTELRGSLR